MPSTWQNQRKQIRRNSVVVCPTWFHKITPPIPLISETKLDKGATKGIDMHYFIKMAEGIQSIDATLLALMKDQTSNTYWCWLAGPTDTLKQLMPWTSLK